MRMMKVKYKVVPNFVIRVQYLFIFNSLPVLFSDKISKALTLSRGGPELSATYFGHISSMEARIFIKFETKVHKVVLNHQPNFHEDLCKDARARGENAKTCDALQRFRSKSTKIKKMRFSAIFE